MVSAPVIAVLQGWSAAGHGGRAGPAASGGALELAAALGPWIFAAAAAALVVRALLERRRFRAAGVLDGAALERLEAELATAERATSAEIAVVVVERADAHPQASWIAGLSTALAATVLCARWLPWQEPALVLAIQLALGTAAYAASELLPGFKRTFVSEARAREMAEEQARQEFLRQGLHRTARGTGVLIFAALLERRAVVWGAGAAGGDAHDAAPPSSEPEALALAIDAEVLGGARRGDLEGGLRQGIRRAAEGLARHFPPLAGDQNEVENRVVVRRQ
jgi:putative membrane protein